MTEPFSFQFFKAGIFVFHFSNEKDVHNFIWWLRNLYVSLP